MKNYYLSKVIILGLSLLVITGLNFNSVFASEKTTERAENFATVVECANFAKYANPLVQRIQRYTTRLEILTSEPDFSNIEAWTSKNYYYQNGYSGQCTHLAGAYYSAVTGLDCTNYGSGAEFVDNLLGDSRNANLFRRTSEILPGNFYSFGPNPYSPIHGHVGIVLSVNEAEGTLTLLDGNSSMAAWNYPSTIICHGTTYNGFAVTTMPILEFKAYLLSIDSMAALVP